MESGPKDVKVVIIGDSGVGKSSIVLRYVTDNFREDSDSTIGSSFMGRIVEVEGVMVKLNIWDTAGQERYHSLARMYYKDADAAILVYDITKKESFQGMLKWYEEIKENGNAGTVIAVAGNKEDLVDKEEVSPDEVFKFIDQIAAIYKKTSAKTNYGIDQLFKLIINKVLPKISQAKNAKNSFSVSTTVNKQKKSCCV